MEEEFNSCIYLIFSAKTLSFKMILIIILKCVWNEFEQLNFHKWKYPQNVFRHVFHIKLAKETEKEGILILFERFRSCILS